MSDFINYRVVKGDTLFGVAKKFGMTVDAIKAANGLTSNNLSVGQTLKVKRPGGTGGDGAGTTSDVLNYRVVSGDTLFGIAKRFGTTVDSIVSLNRLQTNALSVGQLLKIPGKANSSDTTNKPDTSPVIIPPTDVSDDAPSSAANYLVNRLQYAPEIVRNADFNRYITRVRVPGHGTIVASMRDNISYSPHMKYKNGIAYGGQSHIELSLDMIGSVGVSPAIASALQHVSTHEGSFDAINSYDKGIFSYGFIQFTGATATGASLNNVMASMEANAPTLFQQIFKSVGIDTEGGVVTVLDENGQKRRGDDAWLYIQKTVSLYGAFIRAGFEPSLVKEQLRMANTLYVEPALNFKLDVTIGGIRISIPRIKDIINSEAATTAVLAMAINLGIGGMSRILGPAVATVGAQARLQTFQALKSINERDVLNQIAATATDSRVTDRINSVIKDGLSFSKQA